MNNQYYNQGSNQQYNQGFGYGQSVQLRPKTPVEIETEHLKSLSKSHGLTQFIMLGVGYLITFILAFIFGIYLMGTNDILNRSPQEIMSFLMMPVIIISIIATLIGGTVSILWYYKKQKGWFKELIKPKNSNLKYSLNFRSIVSMSSFTLGLNTILGLIALVFIFLFSKFGVDLNATNSSSMLLDFDLPTKIIYVFYAVIIAPVFEEVLFRGIILKPLRRYGDAFAIIISAALFSIAHGNLIQIPSAFGIGLLFGYVTVKNNSILPAIILHFINNLFSTATTFSVMMEGRTGTTISNVFSFIMVISVIYAVARLFTYKRWVKLDNYEEIPKIYQPTKKAKIYFSSVLLAFVIYRIFSMIASIAILFMGNI